MKKAILVIGPPRSGTSVVSHILSKLGVNFGDPKRFVDPERILYNPIFFELQSLNKLNDEMFSYFSKQWNDFDWLPDRTYFDEHVVSAFEGKIHDLIKKEFANGKTIGLKDPRFCYTLPLWEIILNRLGFNVSYVLVRRSSCETFISNELINKFSSAVNFRLVAQSSLMARYFVEGRQFLTVDYEDLLVASKVSVSRICDSFDLDCSLINKACSVIKGDLHHVKATSNAPLYSFFTNVIEQASAAPDEYLRYREVYLTATSERDLRITALTQDLAERNDQIATLNQTLAERDVSVKALSAELESSQDTVAERIG